MSHRPLNVLIAEDEAVLALQLQYLVEDSGHVVVGCVSDLDEAYATLDRCDPDLALVDIHLADGPTGTVLATILFERDIPFVFMTANAKRVPADFAGAVGIIAKPYTANSVIAALTYLHDGVRDPPPGFELPAGLELSPKFSERWMTN